MDALSPTLLLTLLDIMLYTFNQNWHHFEHNAMSLHLIQTIFVDGMEGPVQYQIVSFNDCQSVTVETFMIHIPNLHWMEIRLLLLTKP
jgi:hypothetical protein